jgi:N-dimethylarginine dimethylaminohydrolase
MNMLSIDKHLAVVDKKQTEMIDKLKEYYIDVIPLELRHDRLLAGGFHCVTLDLVRDG